MSDLQRAHVQAKYRPVSVIFAVLVLCLIAGVAYAGWSSTTITVTPKLTKVSASFPVTVTSKTTDEAGVLVGTITDAEKSATVTVTPKGTGTPVPAHATGQITIKNTTATDQPLSVGTRLRSTSDVIVRTTKRVDVPAGGSVVADAIADPLGEEGNIPAGKFVIVALWPGLQDKIYGESATDFTGGLASGGTSLSLDELTAASNQAEEEIRTAVGTSQLGTLISLEPSSVVSVPKPEVPSASYKVTVTVKITTVTYQAGQLTELLRAELEKSLPAGQSLGKIESPAISIQDRPETNQVVLQVEGLAAASLSSINPLLQPTTYVGLTTDEIKKKLSDDSLISSMNVKLSPWWRTTAPDQPERITLIVSPAQS